MTKANFPAISPSDIDNYEGCPKRWNLKRLLRDPRFKFQVTEAISHGNATHERLERYVKYDEVLPDHVLYLMPLFQFLRDDGYELFAELECAVLRDWSVTDWWNKDCYLRGKVDLIAIKGTEAIVIDYKTGKRKTDPTQLKIYAAIIMSVLGLSHVKSYFLWTKTQESDDFSIAAESLPTIRHEIETRIARMENAYEKSEFPARTTPLCGWCPALDTCEEAVYYKAKRDRERR